MKTWQSLVLLTAFIAGALLRKTGWSIGMLILLCSGLLLSAMMIFDGIKSRFIKKQPWKYVLLATWFTPGLCFFLVLFVQQYWVWSPALGYIALFILAVYTPLWILWPGVEDSRNNRILRGIFITLLWVLALPIIILNPRQFHNFFRASTYEEYIRNSISLSHSNLADRFIEQYKDKSPEALKKSDELFDEAVVEDSLKNYPQALILYNRCIDLNPENEKAYFRRGYLKLNHLELDYDVALSAAKDFNRSIRLDSKIAKAWYMRAVTLAYLGYHLEVCNDMKQAYSLDTSLNVKDYICAHCPDSGRSFTKQFHP